MVDLIEKDIDFKEYIQPQKLESDVAYKLLPVNQEITKIKLANNHVKLQVRIKDGLYCQELLRGLIGVCGLQVNVNQLTNKKAKDILKKLGYNKYYEHIPFIKDKYIISHSIINNLLIVDWDLDF
jgi:hypothetical protein